MKRSRLCGVYMIVNSVTGNRYIGSSCDVGRRVTSHFNGYGNLRVHRAVKRYGQSALSYKVLEECERGMLPAREAYWIAALKPEYNFDSPTETGGRTFSDESRLRMSVAKLGKSSVRKGQKHSDDARARMSEAKRGCALSSSHRANIRASAGGWKHTDTAKEKIAAAKRGSSRQRPEGERKRIGRAVAALWANPEYRARQMLARSRNMRLPK